MKCLECGVFNGHSAGCPAAPDDDRDLLELTLEERQARYHELSTIDLIDIIEGAIESVNQLRRDLAVLKAREAR